MTDTTQPEPSDRVKRLKQAEKQRAKNLIVLILLFQIAIIGIYMLIYPFVPIRYETPVVICLLLSFGQIELAKRNDLIDV